jgi:hypothetical protein
MKTLSFLPLLLLIAMLGACSRENPSGPSPTATVDRLRRVTAKAEPGTWKDEVDVAVGGRVFSLVGFGLALAPVEDRVRDLYPVIRAACEVAVSVHRRRHSDADADADADGGRRWMDSVTEEMEGEGWHPMVMVRDGGEGVAVFLPMAWDGKGDLTVCVVVREEHELVLVSARVDPEPVLEFVRTSGVLKESGPLSGTRDRAHLDAVPRLGTGSASTHVRRPNVAAPRDADNGIDGIGGW